MVVIIHLWGEKKNFHQHCICIYVETRVTRHMFYSSYLFYWVLQYLYECIISCWTTCNWNNQKKIIGSKCLLSLSLLHCYSINYPHYSQNNCLKIVFDRIMLFIKTLTWLSKALRERKMLILLTRPEQWDSCYCPCLFSHCHVFFLPLPIQPTLPAYYCISGHIFIIFNF